MAPPSTSRVRTPRAAISRNAAPTSRPPGPGATVRIRAPAASSAVRRSIGAALDARRTVSVSAERILAVGGVRSWVSSAMRMGEAPDTRRTVSWGSSLSTVPTPTRTASQAARSAWESSRSRAPLIHLESPVAVAIRPSTVCAYFSTTHGPVVARHDVADEGRGVEGPPRRAARSPRPRAIRVPGAPAWSAGTGGCGCGGWWRGLRPPRPRRRRRAVPQPSGGCSTAGAPAARRGPAGFAAAVRVVAQVRAEPEADVGVDRVGPGVLLDVGPQLADQADASSLVTGRVDEDAAPERRDPSERGP